MISDFWNHVAIVVFFGVGAVIWAGTVITMGRKLFGKNTDMSDYTIWGFRQDVFGWILFAIPLAAYFIIKDAW